MTTEMDVVGRSASVSPLCILHLALCTSASLQSIESVRLLDELVRERPDHLVRLVERDDVARDLIGQEVGVYAPGDVMPGGDGREGACVVVEAGGVVDAGRLSDLVSKARHALDAVVEPPRWPQAQAGVMAGQRRQLARVRSLIQRE